MSVAAIYRKTAAGERELMQLAQGLTPRLRSMLLLIDGRRTRLDLARAFPELALSPEPLERLAELGLVERIPDGHIAARVVSLTDFRARRQRALQRTGAVATASAERAGVVFAAEIPPPPQPELNLQREAVTSFLIEELGVSAASIEARLRHCATAADLERLIDEIEEMLTRIAEPRLATLFAERFGSLARHWRQRAADC
jgi:hypothetical protein